MARYRNELPQLQDGLFVTDGGLETTLIFHEGIDLPYFAAFDLLKDDAGRTLLTDYFEALRRRSRARRLRPGAGKSDVAGELRLGRQSSVTTHKALAEGQSHRRST